MGSIGALGIGLSVVFSLFLLLLLAELYYLLFWKQSSRMNSVAPDRAVGSAGGGEAAAQAGDTGFLAKIIVGPDGECTLAPPRLLFTIKEETREDLIESEDAKTRKRPKSAAAPRPDHVVLHVQPSSPPRGLVYGRRRYGDGEAPLLHVCSSSTSSDDSPPSSSSSSSCSSSSKAPAAAPADDFVGVAAAGPRTSTSSREEDEEEGPIENRSWTSAQGTATEDETFLTPPSSPGLSSPASSPAPMSRLPALRRPTPVRTQHQLPPIGVQALRILHVHSAARGARVSSSGSASSSVADSPPLSPMASSHRDDDDDEILLSRSIVLPSPSVSLASETWRN